ncbi:MAG: polymer-forming cytoskeletal protein [Thermodesulfobacteriota bacterium]|nr:polymer-forming cytoskeletal protein [Thermodesulfobacteriota bacterium]
MIFNKNKGKFIKIDQKSLEDEVGSAVTVIASDTRFTGNIKGEDTLRISGDFKGDIDCKRMVWIEKTGRIEGTVRARRVIIEGEINGCIKSADHVELRSNGRMIGDINAGKITVAQGCFFDGQARILKK